MLVSTGDNEDNTANNKAYDPVVVTIATCLPDLTTAGAPIGDPNYGVPDGLVTGVDIQFYVNLWLIGCP